MNKIDFDIFVLLKLIFREFVNENYLIIHCRFCKFTDDEYIVYSKALMLFKIKLSVAYIMASNRSNLSIIIKKKLFSSD